MSVVGIGLLGCGVVGSGVIEALDRNTKRIAEQTGIQLEVVRIAVRDIERPRASFVPKMRLCSDWRQICDAPDIDVVVEAMGGMDPAYSALSTALRHGKSVVTANKELLACRGEELEKLAANHGARIFYEATALGGVPAIHTLQTYFAANRVRSLSGIVNGTSNYILSSMESKGSLFAEALVDAQEKGYAEADPTSDIEGFDALFKLQILARLAFGLDVSTDTVERVGIDEVSADDLVLAHRLGYRMKHVVRAKSEADGVIQASVGPALVDSEDPLYHVGGVQNALCIDGDLVGTITLTGPGAGALPTASAIVEDLVKLVSLPGQEPRESCERERAVVKPLLDSHFLVRSREGLTGFARVEWKKVLGDCVDAVVVRLSGDRGVAALLVQNVSMTANDLSRRLHEQGLEDAVCYPFVRDIGILEAASHASFVEETLFAQRQQAVL